MASVTLVDSADLFVLCLLPQAVANFYLRPTISNGMQRDFIFAFLRFTLGYGVSAPQHSGASAITKHLPLKREGKSTLTSCLMLASPGEC